MTHRLTRSIAAGLGALVLVSGCSSAEEDSPGDASASASPTPTPEDTAAVTEQDTAADTAPDTAADTEQDPAASSEATSAPDDAESTTQAAPAQVTSAESAFAFQTPSGWSDVSSEAGAEAVAAVRADDRSADFFTNLVVGAEEPIEDLEESIEESKKTLAGADGTSTQTEETQVDGETAYAFRISRTVQDVEIVQAQRWVEHDGVLYILTMSSARTEQRAALDSLDEIVQSWSWQ